VPTLPMPQFPEWLNDPAVRHEASDLWTKLPTEKDPAKSEEVLWRLISDRRMDRVWREIYKESRGDHPPTGQYSNPAYVTNASVAAAKRRLAAELRNKTGMINEREAKFLEAEAAVLERLGDPPADPRWSEQDRAVQYFLRHTFRNFLDLKPVILSDLKAKMNKLREVVEGLHRQAATLQSLGKESDAQKLEEIASDCDKEARNMIPKNGDNPWVIIRQSEDVELRTFVIDLSITTTILFRKELHSTLATVANVVFDRQDVTRSKVREILRSCARDR
jgi:hypothetical protein